MFWCNYKEEYTELDDCRDCYASEDCDYGYAKEPGEDDDCQYFGRMDSVGNMFCNAEWERHCDHKIYKTAKDGSTLVYCGLYFYDEDQEEFSDELNSEYMNDDVLNEDSEDIEDED